MSDEDSSTKAPKGKGIDLAERECYANVIMVRHRAVLAALVISATAIGCASGRAQIRPTSPFTPQLAQLFDDSVDYIENAEGLGGRLATDWQQQIDGLSRSSDLIAVVRIETVVMGTDLDRSRSYRMAAVISEMIVGTAPEERRVSLRTAEGQAGFTTVLGREDRLQRGRYVLFVKWYNDASGEVRAHWHLSPHSEQILQRVRVASGLNAQQFGQERIVRQE